jgi:hypothetical protein
MKFVLWCFEIEISALAFGFQSPAILRFDKAVDNSPMKRQSEINMGIFGQNGKISSRSNSSINYTFCSTVGEAWLTQ